MTQRIRRRRRQARLPFEQYALSASTRRGRVRGRPASKRGTRIRSSTAANCRLCPRCPAVIRIDSGLRPCSHPRCSFVVHPPRERPNVWSDGSAPATPPGGSFCRSPFGRPGRVLMRPGDRGVRAHIPGDQPGRVRDGLQPGQDPHPSSVTLPAPEQAVHRLPGPVPRWRVPRSRDLMSYRYQAVWARTVPSVPHCLPAPSPTAEPTGDTPRR